MKEIKILDFIDIIALILCFTIIEPVALEAYIVAKIIIVMYKMRLYDREETAITYIDICRENNPCNWISRK